MKSIGITYQAGFPEESEIIKRMNVKGDILDPLENLISSGDVKAKISLIGIKKFLLIIDTQGGGKRIESTLGQAVYMGYLNTQYQ